MPRTASAAASSPLLLRYPGTALAYLDEPLEALVFRMARQLEIIIGGKAELHSAAEAIGVAATFGYEVPIDLCKP